MTTRDWEFVLDGKPYKLKLVHGLTRRRFFLNDDLLLEQKRRSNRQISYSFPIGEGSCEVNLHNIFLEYYYSCFLNDVLIPSVQDTKWRKKPQQGKYASQRIYWFELSRSLNLKLVPAHPELGFLGKPLLGDVGGFLTLIYFGVSSESIPLVYALVRYKPLNDIKPVKTDLNQLLSHAGIFRKSPGCVIDKLANDRILIHWLFNPKKLNADQLKQSLVDVLGVLSIYTSGVSSYKCENPACKNPGDTELKLVLVNSYPSWLCAACIAELDTLGDRTKESYKKTPSNFGRGLGVGFLAALAGSLLWAAWMILFNQIAAAVAMLMLAGIVKAMDMVKTKRTVWSILSAGLLGIGGSILGSYLGALWLTVTKEGVSLSWVFSSFDTFIWYLVYIWNGLWERSTIMQTTIMFSVLGVGLFLWSFWSNQRKALKQMFKPEIHVVSG